jgi:precorrin-4/cobalt-precorrin-4 C11-methyltransferase
MAGRTPTGEQERMRDLAAHQATMVIFLSAGLLKELAEDLLAGGYAKDTPAAIVYKATWPEELVLRCTVGTLEETAKKHGITKTALIAVGRFLGDQYERSKLYDEHFSTGFRQGKFTGNA